MAEQRSEPIIVACAPNGARLGKADHPHLPITASEIAACAESLLACGVSVLHLHVRDQAGGHSLDIDRYREAIGAIRARVDDRMILQVTSEAAGQYQRDQQMALVRALKPEAVSLALREICPGDNDVASAASFYGYVVEAGVWPQHILYSPDDAARFDRLRGEGVFGESRPFALFVLGRYADRKEGSPAELDEFLARIDPQAFPWAVCCFGRREAEVMAYAAEAGGHIRIGFENNQQLPDGRQAPDNASLVRATLARIRNRPVADSDWVRHHMLASSRAVNH